MVGGKKRKRGAGRRTSLSLEALERRLLLTTLVGQGVDTPVTDTITDASGDQLLLRFAAPDGATAEVVDTNGNPGFAGLTEDDIGAVRFTGTDALTEFSIEDVNPGLGGDTINVAGGPANDGIRTTDESGVGLIALGVKPDGTDAGEASFGTAVGVNIGARLGAFITSGELDFDAGATYIAAGGDIGVVSCDALILRGGAAEITAGSGGSGDLSHLIADSVLDGTGGPIATPTQVRPGSPAVIWDDAGDGAGGRLIFATPGVKSAADVWDVPLTGGGRAVARVEVEGTLYVAARGTGGDLGLAEMNAAGSSLHVGGVADTDLGVVQAPGTSIGRVINLTRGGDIYTVSAGGGIDFVMTGPRGNVGALFDGQGNSNYTFPQDNYFQGSGVVAGAQIGTIRTGSVVNAVIDTSAGVGAIRTGQGGLLRSRVSVGTGLEVLQTGYIADSDVSVGGEGMWLVVNQDGIYNSEMTYLGGLSKAFVGGEMVNSTLSSLQNDGTSAASGSRINYLRTRGLSGSRLEAYGGFGTVSVRGEMSGSVIDTSFWDSYLGQDVGADIEVLRTGSISDSTVDVQTSLGLLLTRGLTDSSVNMGGNMGQALIRGDLLRSQVEVGGDLEEALLVNGNAINSSGYAISVGGSSQYLRVYGKIISGNGIDIGGEADRVIVTGGVTDGAGVIVDGNCSYLRVGQLGDSSYVRTTGDCTVLRVGRASQSSNIDIGGNSRLVRLRNTGELGNISVSGRAGLVFISGYAGALDGGGNSIVVGGNLGVLRVSNSLVNYGLDVNGSTSPATILVKGEVSGVAIDAEGRIDTALIKGAAHGSSLDAAGGFGSLVFRGDVVNSHITTRAYDGAGEPVGGGLGFLSASGLRNVDVDLHQNLGTASVTGLLDRVNVNLVARKNYGAGAVVGGGRIDHLSARGLVDSSITTYGALRSVRLRSTGIDGRSTLHTLDSGTTRGTNIYTSGLIFGHVRVAADIGNVLTRGTAAAEPSALMYSPVDGSPVDYLFTDPGGATTGGTLSLGGEVRGTVS